jgi:hypothetical protein
MEGDATHKGENKPGLRYEVPKHDLLSKGKMLFSSLSRQREHSGSIQCGESNPNDVVHLLQCAKIAAADEFYVHRADVRLFAETYSDLSRRSFPYMRNCLGAKLAGQLSRKIKSRLNAGVIQIKANKFNRLSFNSEAGCRPQSLHREDGESAASGFICHTVKGMLLVAVTSVHFGGNKRPRARLPALKHCETRNRVPDDSVPGLLCNHPLLKPYGVQNFNSNLGKLRSVMDIDLGLDSRELEACLDDEWMPETQARSHATSPFSETQSSLFPCEESIFSL